MEQTAQQDSPSADYGLRREILSPMETLAQSVSTMAPTTTPAAAIPLVCALARQWHVARVWPSDSGGVASRVVYRPLWAPFSLARSLYTYASMTLPPWRGATVGWSLLLAYVATGSSVIGGFYHYANLLLHDATGHGYSTVLLANAGAERSSLKFTLDVFNLTNTASLDIPIDDMTQNINFNGFPAVGQSVYVSPTLSGLGITNKTIGSPRQIQMSLSFIF